MSLNMRMKKRMPGNEIPQFGRGAVNVRGLFPSRLQAIGLVTVAVFCLAAVFLPTLPAKEKKPVTKTVSGFVLDANENGIVDAAVSITNLQSGKKYTTVSKEGGRFQFADLSPHDDYEVQAVYKDMSSEVRKVSSLDTRLRIVLNLRIPPPQD
jgi:hypothetical protein